MLGIPFQNPLLEEVAAVALVGVHTVHTRTRWGHPRGVWDPSAGDKGAALTSIPAHSQLLN